MNRWDQRYAEAGFAYGREPNDFLAAEAHRLAPGSRVLSLAEGEGRNAVWLAERGHQVLGVDSSRVGLGKARGLAEERGVRIETLCADLADFRMSPNSFDALVLVFCHMPPPMREKVHAEGVAALRPGGWLLLEAYRPEQLELRTGGPPRAELMFTLPMLQQDFAELEVVRAEEVERDIVEGRLHRGRSATVQVVARKRPESRGSQE